MCLLYLIRDLNHNVRVIMLSDDKDILQLPWCHYVQQRRKWETWNKHKDTWETLFPQPNSSPPRATVSMLTLDWCLLMLARSTKDNYWFVTHGEFITVPWTLQHDSLLLHYLLLRQRCHIVLPLMMIPRHRDVRQLDKATASCLCAATVNRNEAAPPLSECHDIGEVSVAPGYTGVARLQSAVCLHEGSDTSPSVWS